ncbi:MAG: PAS domain-containing protein [Betaproteobacteria bacterium]|nr:PAS domain-containing protein [Betaproteobacteria bacterium]
MADDFGSLFAFLPIGAYRSRPDGLMVRANPALVRLNGFESEAEQLAGVNDIAGRWYVDPGRRDEFQRLMERDGRVIGLESEVWRYKTRERIWVSENAHAVHDAAGRVLFYEGTVEEITDRVRARERLERSEEDLRAITAQVPGVVYRVVLQPDGAHRLDFLSDGIRTLFGIPPEAALLNHRLLARVRHVDDRKRVSAEIEAAAKARGPLDVEYRVVLDDGTQKWVQQLSVAAADSVQGQVRVGVMIDISERKRAELALLRNSELWKLALECTGDGVWDWQVQEGREVLSAQCKALYGFGPNELPDTPDALDSRTHPDDLPAMRAARNAHFAGRAPTYANEHRVQCKDGGWKWILSRGMVLERDAQGQPLRMIGTHTDITARKQADELRIERDLAAAADRAKSAFLSRVSHELRTPLNAVLGFSQLLELEPGDGERQRRWVAQVLSSGRHLLALMDDVLDISSAQTGQLPLALETLPLQPLVTEAVAMLSGAAVAAGVHLHDDTGHDTGDTPPLTVRADRKRLLQVLSNLLSNAIKYNRPGGWVRLRAEPGDGTLVLSVADSGPGLDAAQRARLFQPFERVGAQHGAVPGTGLGLALSRQLAEAMGGGITVESAPGRGSTFRVTLPVS